MGFLHSDERRESAFLKSRLTFYAKCVYSNVVVVDDEEIGVIVKTWHNHKRGYHYDVYVRNYNGIKEYTEEQINHFVYSKSLSEEEKGFY